MLNLLKLYTRKCFSYLPSNAKIKFERAAFCTTDTLRSWKLASVVVEGIIKHDHLKGSAIYFGDKSKFSYWANRFFSHTYKSIDIGQFRLIDIARFKHKLSEYDIAVCPLNPATELLFSAHGWRVIPERIDWFIDLRKPLNEIFRRKNIKKKISSLRKYNYTFRITTRESALKEFYHEMLVPTVTKRHKEHAFISDFSEYKKKLKNGYLLKAYQDKEWIAAALVVLESSKILRAANWAWRNGDICLMKNRITSALTVEQIIRAKTEGFEYLNLGNSHPFVDDGVFEFKHHWGFTPVIQGVDLESGKLHKTGGFLAVYFNLASNCGQSILHYNPVLEKHRQSLRGIAWGSSPPPKLRRLFTNGIPWVDLKNTLSVNRRT
jgi:hypothetical protein